ncbi:MAG: DEAD/DEAH box helicase, partial [Rhizobiales bacterium]|nr:DEAD/DEAH box helicase [Hyphomicrobiales bacterium]
MSLFDALPAIKNQTAQKPGQFTAQLPIQAPTRLRNRNVTAVLGPTNTGKTYLAIERMLGHESGIIGLPLRLLAREVYNKVVDRVGPEKVALVTGEEKIYPKDARYFICTVEALPNHTNCAFAAIDEVQLASDLDRGHIFTDRILNLRGTQETLLLGAETMRGILERLLPGVNVITRPRMSVLAYTGSKKLTRLPHRSAIVTFSANEVYAIAELIRRQRGGAAVVLGSLSPRTRNKQVELYQNGDVDYLIATDAIGMGLNLDVDHVAFASDSKYDGFQYRPLTAAEIGQIAGRAGRHLRDGTFGVSHAVQPFNDELVQAIESHRFPPVKILQWRNRELDFSTLEDLRHALDVTPDQPGLTRAPPSDDIEALDRLPRDPEVKALVTSPDKVELLWNACRIPDYQNISPGQHSDMVSQIFRFLAKDGRIDEDWFARQVKRADKPVGDIDTLSARIAEVRTWTFVANRADWLEDSWSWQEETRAVENRLSDALHDQLTQRFVDRRTAVLMRQLKEKTMLDAEINDAGDVMVEGHHVGQLSGFRFQPDPTAEGIDAKAVRSAADKILADAISKKAAKAAQSPNEDFTLGSDQSLRWRGEVVTRVIAGAELLKPRMLLLSDEQLNGAPRDQIQERLDLWLETHIKTLLKPLFDLKDAENLSGTARGLAFRLSEAYGIVARQEVSEDVRALDQETRAGLRQLGIRFGAFHIFVPQLLKPAPSKLLVDLFV